MACRGAKALQTDNPRRSHCAAGAARISANPGAGTAKVRPGPPTTAPPPTLRSGTAVPPAAAGGSCGRAAAATATRSAACVAAGKLACAAAGKLEREGRKVGLHTAKPPRPPRPLPRQITLTSNVFAYNDAPSLGSAISANIDGKGTIAFSKCTFVGNGAVNSTAQPAACAGQCSPAIKLTLANCKGLAGPTKAPLATAGYCNAAALPQAGP